MHAARCDWSQTLERNNMVGFPTSPIDVLLLLNKNGTVLVVNVVRTLFLWLECSFLYFLCIFLWMIRRWGFIETKSCLQSASSMGPFASTLQFC
jgi:hypothetical protein